MNMSAWLKSMEDKWQESVETAKAGGQYERHPDGRYTTRLTNWELGETNDGKGVHKITFTIISGDLEGETLYSTNGLEGDRSLEFLAKDLARFGYDPETFKLRSVPKILAEITEKKPVVKVLAKTKGEYQNVYIQKVMDDDYDPDDEEPTYSGDTDEDEPAPVRRSARAAATPVAPTRTARRAAPVVEEDDEDEEEEAPPARPARRTAAPAKPVGKAAKAVAAPPAKPIRRPAPAAAPEPEDDEEEEDDAAEEELEIGAKVSFMRRGVETEGFVTEIDEENEIVHVKVGSKTYPVDATEIEIL